MTKNLFGKCIAAVLLLGLFYAVDPGHTFAQNRHPAYLRALTDPRSARAHLEGPDRGEMEKAEKEAMNQIDQAIDEIKRLRWMMARVPAITLLSTPGSSQARACAMPWSFWTRPAETSPKPRTIPLQESYSNALTKTSARPSRKQFAPFPIPEQRFVSGGTVAEGATLA
jgi:hypothetical protein